MTWPQHSLGPRKIFWAYDVSCWGNREQVRKHSISPTTSNTAKEAHFSLNPSRVLNCELCNGVEKGWKRAANSTQHSKRMDHTYCITNSIKSSHEPLGTLQPQIPLNGSLAHLIYTHPHPVSSSLYMLLTVVARVSFTRWLVRKHRKPAQT